MASLIRTVYPWIQFIVLSYFFTKVIRTLQFYLLYSSDLSQYKPKSRTGKSWALVTGASDGIGKGFARELCAKGFNVIIHGRNEKKLQGVRTELENDFKGSEIRLLVIDAMSSSWLEAFDSKVLKVVKDLNLTILINNVGGSGGIRPDWSTVAHRSAWELDAFINLNTRFMAQITRVLIPILSQDKSQQTAILNVSSGAELLAAPYLVAYSATKAFISRWSRSLDAEFRAEKFNIDVMSIIVGKVVTTGTGRYEADENLFCPNVTTMARAALSKLGCGHVVCTPYWAHGLQVWLLTGLLPSFVADKFGLDMAREEMRKMQQLEKAK